MNLNHLIEMTPRELQVLQLRGQGLRYNQIARFLGVSRETIKSHLKNIYQKQAIHKSAQTNLKN